jgi:hypothetical protein
MFSLLIALLILAVLIWGGDRLLALVPASPKLIAAIRIIAIVCVALYVISLVAGFFGVAVPWYPTVVRGRH